MKSIGGSSQCILNCGRMSGMKNTLLLLCTLSLLVIGLTAPFATSHRDDRRADLLAASQQTSALAKQVLEATVHFVQVVKRGEDGGIERGSGSGFVVDAVKGCVITNHHVVGEVGSVLRVQLRDGRIFDGTVVGSDSRTDVGVVRIPEGVVRHQLAWGDSEALQNGAWVMAVGNPLGLVGTSSLGVVSGLHRELKLRPNFLSDFIQSDAFIDRGSSGGPLVDMAGRVLGINTAIEGGAWQGKGWAVPAHLARPVAEAIWETGEMERGWMGLIPETLDSAYAAQVGMQTAHGVRVKNSKDGSPSRKAGLQRGDVLLSMDGVLLFSTGQLRARAGVLVPGKTVSFEIWRNGATQVLRLQTVARPK